MDSAVDAATFIRTSLLEMLYAESYRATDKTTHQEFRDKLPVYMITDCKSLYDHLVRLSPPSGLEERRVAIDICSIRESPDSRYVRWTPTQEMLADCLTKPIAPNLIEEKLRTGFLRLVSSAT